MARTEAEVDELCEQRLREKDAELAKEGKRLSEDYKRGFRETFASSYYEAYARTINPSGRADIIEVNRLHRELLAMLPRDLDIAAPVCTTLMATIAATYGSDRATRQKILSIMYADAKQLAESPTAARL
jgi:hypothetical protein